LNHERANLEIVANIDLANFDISVPKKKILTLRVLRVDKFVLPPPRTVDIIRFYMNPNVE
jgi:hypothetical protein